MKIKTRDKLNQFKSDIHSLAYYNVERIRCSCMYVCILYEYSAPKAMLKLYFLN